MTTGQRIRQARKNAGMTQADLAERLNISYVNITQWESGKRNPKTETLAKIADVLGVALVDLDERFALADNVGIVEPSIDDLREEVGQLRYSLNERGLGKTRDYMRDLMKNPDNCPPPARRSRKDTDSE